MTVRSNCLLHAGERVVITNQTRGTAERSLLEFSDHEHVGWHIVLAPETVPKRGNETEARIVSRVTDHYYSATAEIFATRQTPAHERRADALALLIGNDSHWGKPQHVQAWVVDQGHS